MKTERGLSLTISQTARASKLPGALAVSYPSEPPCNTVRTPKGSYLVRFYKYPDSLTGARVRLAFGLGWQIGSGLYVHG